MDAPATDIRIKVGASEYEPRWSFLAEYILSSRNLSLQDVLTELNTKSKRSLAVGMELLAACLAHLYPAGEAPKAAFWAAQLLPGQFQGIVVGLLKAGRAAGVIVPIKNEPKPETIPAIQEMPETVS